MTNNYRHLDPETRTRTATYLLAQLTEALDPLAEQSQNLINEENEKLVFKAITLTDLLLKRLEDSAHKYQLVINHPRYEKGEKVILNLSSDQQSIQTIKEVYFDHNQDEWLYKFEPNSSILHEFYSETFLSKVLD